jgi:ribosomal protein L3
VAEKNLLVIKGCVPGCNNSYVIIQVMEVKVRFQRKDTGRKVELSDSL